MTRLFILIVTHTPPKGRKVILTFDAAAYLTIKKDLINMASYTDEHPVGWPIQFSMCRYELRDDTGGTLIRHATLNTLLTYLGELEEVL